MHLNEPAGILRASSRAISCLCTFPPELYIQLMDNWSTAFIGVLNICPQIRFRAKSRDYQLNRGCLLRHVCVYGSACVHMAIVTDCAEAESIFELRAR